MSNVICFDGMKENILILNHINALFIQVILGFFLLLLLLSKITIPMNFVVTHFPIYSHSHTHMHTHTHTHTQTHTYPFKLHLNPKKKNSIELLYTMSYACDDSPKNLSFSAGKKIPNQKMLLQITDTTRAKTHDSLDDFDTFDSRYCVYLVIFFFISQHCFNVFCRFWIWHFYEQIKTGLIYKCAHSNVVW